MIGSESEMARMTHDVQNVTIRQSFKTRFWKSVESNSVEELVTVFVDCDANNIAYLFNSVDKVMINQSLCFGYGLNLLISGSVFTPSLLREKWSSSDDHIID